MNNDTYVKHINWKRKDIVHVLYVKSKMISVRTNKLHDAYSNT
jgi:hypothetical protein